MAHRIAKTAEETISKDKMSRFFDVRCRICFESDTGSSRVSRKINLNDGTIKQKTSPHPRTPSVFYMYLVLQNLLGIIISHTIHKPKRPQADNRCGQLTRVTFTNTASLIDHRERAFIKRNTLGR